MSTSYSPKIVTDGLVLYVDAANIKSYAGSGTDWIDLSGNNNSGSLINGPTFSSANGGGINFDGTNDYCQVEWSSRLAVTENYTVEIFVSESISPGTARRAIAFNSAGTVVHVLFVGSNGTGGGGVRSYLIRRASSGSPNYHITGSNGIPTGFNQIVATFNGSVHQMYCNGVLEGNAPFGDATAISLAATPTDTFFIAQRGDLAANTNFRGIIHNVKIYNRALSANEVLQNFNATRNRFGV